MFDSILDKDKFQNFFKDFSTNLNAGLTVALISFPLSIAIAVSSGASPVTGLIAGTWAGLLGVFLLHTRFIIVGVAASTLSLQAGFLISNQDQIGNNSLLYISSITILSGLFLLLIRLFNLQNFIKYVPSAIVTGFASGVGLVIAISQVKEVVGFDPLSLSMASEFMPLNLVIFILSLIIILVVEKLTKKVPSAIVISVIGVGVGYLANLNNWNLRLLQFRFPNLESTVFEFSNYSLLNFAPSLITDLLVTSGLIAIVIVLESLITARFISQESNTSQDPKRDILGVGLINILVGLVGGMPVLSLISRSSVNLQMKATTNLATLAYGLIMLVMVLALSPLIGFYPFGVIAAILMRVALPLVKLPDYQNLFRTDKGNFIVAVLVALLVVLANASIAVVVGAVLSLLLILRKLSKSEFEIQIFKNSQSKTPKFSFVGYQIPSDLPSGDKVIYKMEGIVTYFNAALHSQRLESLQTKKLVLDMQYLFLMDFEGSEVLEKTIEEISKSGVEVSIINLHRNVEKIFKINPTITVLMQKANL
jgi:SulP family sulfate permease